MDELEYYFILIIAKIIGISSVIKYLRNPNPKITIRLLKTFGAKIGDRTTIKRSIFLDNVYEDENSTGDFSHLEIGKNCFIGDCTFFDLANKVIIEDNVVVSAKVSFITHADCNRSSHLQKLYPRTCKKITVKSGAWIALGATLLNGVNIGKNSVVAAHALVNKNVEESSVYGGIPATKIK